MPGLGHVNTYCLVGNGDTTLVDPGLPSASSYRALKSRLKQAGVRLQDINQVVVTHSHPDHYGGVRRLLGDSPAKMVTHSDFGRLVLAPGVHECSSESTVDQLGNDDSKFTGDQYERSDKPASMTPSGKDKPLLELDGSNRAHREVRREKALAKLESAFYVENFDRESWKGPVWLLPRPWNSKPLAPPLSRSKALAMRLAGPVFIKGFLPPQPARRVKNTDQIELGGRVWQAVHTPGHTLDHLCLFQPDLGLLISGDHVLPTITPHVPGVGGGPDPLSYFLDSLGRIEELGGVDRVLPAHGHPFSNLSGRIETIKQHHDDRLNQIVNALAKSGSMRVEDVSKVLFRPQRLGPMADSESFAHLEHLRLAKRVSVRREKDELVYELS